MHYLLKILQLLALLFFFRVAAYCETAEIPEIHAHLEICDEKLIYIDSTGDTLRQEIAPARYTLSRLRCQPLGTDSGVSFDFGISDFSGRLYYGFIPSTDEAKHPYPIYRGRRISIDSGRAQINIIKSMSGKYDIIDWRKTGLVRLGYRVLDEAGYILYDGKFILKGVGPFELDSCIVEGPFINMVTDSGAVVSFETNFPLKASIKIDNSTFSDIEPVKHHEIRLSELKPDTEYKYTVHYGNYHDQYSFRTAPRPGARKAFCFAYASDGRGNAGGGERYIKGTNGYIMKKAAALVTMKNARFFQFTGDMIDGYKTDPNEIALEYANWKRAVEPFAHYIPFIATPGNHEVLMTALSAGKKDLWLDCFPYATRSTEVVFAENFVNPKNGPISEDGAAYDPNPDKIDFPPYDETVFSYTYDNIAMISLNSNYWYATMLEDYPDVGGNLHGYIMDNQLRWLKERLASFEKDKNIDFIFVTIHTPVFPNGGHVNDDMWYGGDNRWRPYIAGIPVKKGIIERRDQFLDLLMNGSSKMIGVLTGDEHNYNRLRLTEEMPIYPADYPYPKLKQIRPLWFINNGACGAPYYGKETTPWMNNVEKFSTQNAVVFFYVHGKSLRVEVINPDTMELIDQFVISQSE